MLMKMRYVAVAIVAAMPFVFTSCGGPEGSRSGVTAEDGVVNSVEVVQSLKSISRSYKMVSEEDTCWLTIINNVDWPEKIGSADITALQDTIMALSFRTYRQGDIDTSMKNYASDTRSYELGTAEAVDSVPAEASTKAYYHEVKGRVIQLNTRYLSYEVSSTQYLGGAHPYSSSVPFTFDLAEGKVLEGIDLFKPDMAEELTMAVRSALAERYGAEDLDLESVGFFSNDIVPSDFVYVCDNMIVFYYNEYDIAPYYMGAIEVRLSPWMIENCLTPMAKKLLL